MTTIRTKLVDRRLRRQIKQPNLERYDHEGLNQIMRSDLETASYLDSMISSNPEMSRYNWQDLAKEGELRGMISGMSRSMEKRLTKPNSHKYRHLEGREIGLTDRLSETYGRFDGPTGGGYVPFNVVEDWKVEDGNLVTRRWMGEYFVDGHTTETHVPESASKRENITEGVLVRELDSSKGKYAIVI